jgi:hypothetical protein
MAGLSQQGKRGTVDASVSDANFYLESGFEVEAKEQLICSALMLI